MIPTEPGHPCSRLWSAGEFSKVPVRWMNFCSHTDAERLPRNHVHEWEGVCGYSHRTFALSKGVLLPLALHEISISQTGLCSEAQRCLARQCPLNRTSPERLGWLVGLKRRQTPPQTIPLTDARYCELFRDKPTKGGILITGDDLADLLDALGSFHVEAVSGNDRALVEEGVRDLWVDVPDMTGSDLAFVEAGRNGGLSLLAEALAMQAVRQAAEGWDEQEWLSNFSRRFPRNRDSHRAFLKAVTELQARGPWPWTPNKRKA